MACTSIGDRPAGLSNPRYAGGGALADMGVHAIDVARYLLGDPQPSALRPDSTEYTDYDVDDSGTIWINWADGATSIVESGWWWPHADGPEASTQIYGSKAFAQLFPTRLKIPDRAAETVTTVDPGYPPVREEQCPQIMYDRQMAHFITCIREDRMPIRVAPRAWSICASSTPRLRAAAAARSFRYDAFS